MEFRPLAAVLRQRISPSLTGTTNRPRRSSAELPLRGRRRRLPRGAAGLGRRRVAEPGPDAAGRCNRGSAMTDSTPGTGFGKGHHLKLIDGSAYIFRAYHALPPLTRKSDGLPIGAVAGFTNMLFKHVEDRRAATRRRMWRWSSTIRPRPSATRSTPSTRPTARAPPEDLRPQFPLTREATRAFNVACLEIEGYEADDIIATPGLPRPRRRRAGDHRLVRQGPDAAGRRRGRDARPDEEPHASAATGCSRNSASAPNGWSDVQALAGDSVDNVPGAPGIGIKTAALLINEYGDLETLLARAEEIKQPKRRADADRQCRADPHLEAAGDAGLRHAAGRHAGRAGGERARPARC